MKNPIAIGPDGSTIIDLDDMIVLRFNHGQLHIQMRADRGQPHIITGITEQDWEKIKHHLTHETVHQAVANTQDFDPATGLINPRMMFAQEMKVRDI